MEYSQVGALEEKDSDNYPSDDNEPSDEGEGEGSSNSIILPRKKPIPWYESDYFIVFLVLFIIGLSLPWIRLYFLDNFADQPEDVASNVYTLTDDVPIQADTVNKVQSAQKEISQIPKWCYNKDKDKSLRFQGAFLQDKWLFEAIFSSDNGKNPSRVYIDVGASHSYTLSSSWFYDLCLGWSGVCIEPYEVWWDSLRNRSCTLHEACVSDKRENQKFLYSPKPGERFSGGTAKTIMLPKNVKKSYKRMDLLCMTLEDVFANNHISHVDFMTMGINGGEFKALKGVNWSTVQIDVIVIGITIAYAVEYLEKQGFERRLHIDQEIVMVHKSTGYGDRIDSWFKKLQKNDETKCIHTDYCVCNCHGVYESPAVKRAKKAAEQAKKLAKPAEKPPQKSAQPGGGGVGDKVEYEMVSSGKNKYCDSRKGNLIFQGNSDNCEAKCTEEKECVYYSDWNTPWCRLSKVCEKFASDANKDFKIVNKKKKGTKS